MSSALLQHREVTLVEALDRALNKGVVLNGDLTVSLAGVDLIFVGLRLLVASVETADTMTVCAGPTVAPPRLSGSPMPDDGTYPAGTGWFPMQDESFPAMDSPHSSSLSHPSMGEGGGPDLSTHPEKVEQGLAKLVLTLIETVRQLMEKQAMRRMEGGRLREDEIERLGNTLMSLKHKMQDLKKVFGLKDEDLNLNLGPLGKLQE